MFTHLHVHSHFSLLESSIRIDDLVEAAVKMGMKALALTDKYVMSGAVQFYKTAKAKGIKPITGCEVCLLEKNQRNRPTQLSPSFNLSHLTLLAKNKKGHENLCRLVGKSHMRHPANTTDKEGKASVIPVTKMEDLKNFSEGLVCLSGCNKGRLAQLLKDNNTDEAIRFAQNIFNIFGQDFYIELQRYRAKGSFSGLPGIPASSVANPQTGLSSEALAYFSQKTKIPAVATNNVHYLLQNDYRIYKSLSKIRLMGTRIDPTGNIIKSDEHYLKSHSEMAMLFADIPAAVKNTQIIAEKCSFDFDLGKTILPAFKTPRGQSQDKYLAELCSRGLKFRFGNDPSQKIRDRLLKELDVIAKTGFAGYFLIVADIAEFAYKNRIPICGKGSSAGSLVSYLLRISNVDPLENNLYFERFLNEERKELPDIDVDVSSKDREKIWHYLRSKYGQNSIARVSSFATTRPRASIRESGRILSMAKEDIDFIIKSAPEYNRFYTADKMKNSLKSGRLIDLKDPTYGKILSLSKDIGGYIRHISMHPSAFIVSNYDLFAKLPLTLSETGEVMSQYDMNSIDDIGILKIDLINSLSLSLIADVCLELEKKRGIKTDMANMSYDDKNVFELMQKGDTLGVFQLESFGIRTLARKIRPACLNDITLLISLYRPGPQQSGMVNNFIERKFGREKISCAHKDLEPILKETFGVILYQEQAMQVAIKIAGYCLSEADGLRKAMVNLSRERMLSQQQRFMLGGLAQGYDTCTVSEAFRLISKFASYGFVKAHAAAYAEISYKTCFLKHYYPAEFLATILTNNSGYYSKMQYLEEARRLGIDLRHPDINKSGFEFIVEDFGKAIRVPLVSVRDLGYTGTNLIIKERERNGSFLNFTDFYCRVIPGCRITKTAVENLIKVGAFNFTGISVKQLLIEFYCLKKFKKITVRQAQDICCKTYKYHQMHRHTKRGANKYSDSYKDKYNTPASAEPFFECADFFSSNTATEYIKSISVSGSSSKDFSMEEKLIMEAQLLGFYVSAHPLQIFRQSLEKLWPGTNLITKSGSFYGKLNNYYIFAAGIIISRRIEKTKNNETMMFCTMEDEDGMYEALFFPDAYNKYMKIISNDRFIIIKGRLNVKDNSASLIGRAAFSISSFKKNEELKKEEVIKEDFLAGLKNPWASTL